MYVMIRLFIFLKKLPLIINSIILVVIFSAVEYLIDSFLGDGNGIAFLNISSILLYFKCLLVLGASLYSLRNHLFSFNVLMLCFLCVLSELVFFFFIEIKKAEHKEIKMPELNQSRLIGDPYIGFKNNPGANVNAIKYNLINGDTVYNVWYHIDSNGARNRHLNDSNDNKYALFLGCSVTFGSGLSDNKTLPFYFDSCSNYKSYNYGVGGYGTQQVTAMLEKKNIRNEIKEKNGVGLYVFIDDHIIRSNRSLKRISTWGSNHPDYVWKGDSLINIGLYRNTLSVFDHLLTFVLTKSKVLNYFNVDSPFTVGAKDFLHTAQLIFQAKKNYVRQFKNDNFYVVISPGCNYDITSYLKNKKIKFLDMSKSFKIHKSNYISSKYDRHFNGDFNKSWARELHEKIARL